MLRPLLLVTLFTLRAWSQDPPAPPPGPDLLTLRLVGRFLVDGEGYRARVSVLQVGRRVVVVRTVQRPDGVTVERYSGRLRAGYLEAHRVESKSGLRDHLRRLTPRRAKQRYTLRRLHRSWEETLEQGERVVTRGYGLALLLRPPLGPAEEATPAEGATPDGTPLGPKPLGPKPLPPPLDPKQALPLDRGGPPDGPLGR